MMITGTFGCVSLTFASSESPDSPLIRMSETSTCGSLTASACCTSYADVKVWYGMPSRASAFSSTQRIDRSSSTIQTDRGVTPGRATLCSCVGVCIGWVPGCQAAARDASIGSRIVNVVRPGRLSHSIVPPCWAT